MQEFLTAGDLRRRGWTGALIRRFAVAADDFRLNPHYPGGPPMRLYRAERIAAIEAVEQFKMACDAAVRRKSAAAKGLATKARRAAASAAENILPPVLPAALVEDELASEAVRWFNGCATWRMGAAKWASAADARADLHRLTVDFIFDRMSDYRRRAQPVGIPVKEAAAAVDAKLLAAIAEQYPWLAGECARRSERDVDNGSAGHVDPVI